MTTSSTMRPCATLPVGFLRLLVVASAYVLITMALASA
jgi:hypothetical protein